MYVGSELSPTNVIFDTRSYWSWIPSKDCSDNKCGSVDTNPHNNIYSSTSTTQNKFKYEESDSFAWIANPDSSNTTHPDLYYLEQDWKTNNGKVTGYLASDRFCLTESSRECLDSSFQFIAVDNTLNLDDKVEYGVIGLLPNSSDNFLTALSLGSSDIKLNVFTTRMVSAYFESYIEFGRTDRIQRIAGSKGISYAWAALANTSSEAPVHAAWACVLRQSDVTNLVTGDVNLTNTIADGSLDTSDDSGRGVIFDTTSDYDYVPLEDLENIRDFINAFDSTRACVLD